MTTTPKLHLHELRVRNNLIEARISALRPDPEDYPERYRIWEEAMELAGKQFAEIQKLISQL